MIATYDRGQKLVIVLYIDTGCVVSSGLIGTSGPGKVT